MLAWRAQGLFDFAFHVFDRRLNVVNGQGRLPATRRHGILAFDNSGDEDILALFDQGILGFLVAELRLD